MRSSRVYTFNNISPKTIGKNKDRVASLGQEICDSLDDYIFRYKTYIEKKAIEAIDGIIFLKHNKLGFKPIQIFFDSSKNSIYWSQEKSIAIDSIIYIRREQVQLSWYQKLPDHYSTENGISILYTKDGRQKILKLVGESRVTVQDFIGLLEHLCRDRAKESFIRHSIIHSYIVNKHEKLIERANLILETLELSPLDTLEISALVEQLYITIDSKIDLVYRYVVKFHDLANALDIVDKKFIGIDRICKRFLL